MEEIRGSRYVLDAFALIAYLREEPGAARMRELLRGAADGAITLTMSLVNWGEVVYDIQRRTPQEMARTVATIDSMPIGLVAADRALAYAAAQFKARGGLSYADCYAAALAQRNDAAVVTGDPEFHSVENEIEIEWLPQRSRL